MTVKDIDPQQVLHINADNGSDPYGFTPYVDINLVGRRLKERRKFDTAARALGKGPGGST